MKLSYLLAAGLVLAVATLTFAGKKDQERMEALESRIEALEQTIEDKLAQLESMVDQKIDEAVQELAQRETKAEEELRAIADLHNQGKHIDAKTRMDAFLKKFAGTNAVKTAARLNQELSVIGKTAPVELGIEKWFVGDGQGLDLTADGTTMLVFFEEWCPHCKREVPKLQQTYDKLKGNGLRIVGLTKVNKSSTDEKVSKFCETHKLGFPIGKENGQLSQYFNVRGIPAAAVVQNGKVIWRGHPGRLNESMLESWL